MQEYSYGFIVFRKNGKDIEYLLIKHNAGHWSLPKGHPEPSETPLQTAKRELFEETGIKEINIVSKQFINYSFEKNGQKIEKIVGYFVGELVKPTEVKILADELNDYKWANITEAKNIITYPDSYEILLKANQDLQKTPT